VVDIFGKPEGFTRVKECLNSEINIDTVLAEKLLQLKFSAAHSVSFPAGGDPGLYSVPSSKGVLPYSGTKRMTVFKTARRRAAPVGREEMDVRNRRVSYTHAWIGRRSRRSEVSSSGEAGLWVGTTKSGVFGLAAAVLTLLAAFFFDFPAAGLVAAVELASGFLGPAVFLVAVTLGCLDNSVTG
jgi:hypothetical protein